MKASPSISFRFHLSIENSILGEEIVFNEISGVTMVLRPHIENMQSAIFYPSLTKYSNLLLKNAIVSQNSEIVNWCAKALNDTLGKSNYTHDITLKLVDVDGRELKQWHFSKAYPINWVVNSGSDLVSIECLELAYGFLQ